ncbi:MAG: multicopper oxidase domain-containing protein [bacterium]
MQHTFARSLSRRQWLVLAGAGTSAAAMAGVPGSRGRTQKDAYRRFSEPFRAPPVLQPTTADGDADYFDLVEEARDIQVMPGALTRIWGYNGSFPGPTISVTRNRRAVLRVHNALTAHTAVHLHGGNTDPASDGFPTDMIVAGAQREYVYANRSRAATLWYHDHAMDHTGRNVYMGLAGLYLIRDEEEAALRLPAGQNELPMILQQRRITQAGELAYQDGDRIGVGGDITLVNGVPWPLLEVAARKYRLRILNASNSTSYTVRLSSGEPLLLVGNDGGLLAAPVECAQVPLAMGERADVIVDFSALPVGSTVDLVNAANADEPESIVRCIVVRRERDDSSVPSRLSTIDVLAPQHAARTRVFAFGGKLSRAFPPVSWAINGETFDPDRPIATVRSGESEIWTFENHRIGPLGMLHPVHVHLSPFQVLRRNDGPPLPHEGGWKDTVALGKGERVDVIVRFDGFRGRYLMHCHNLEHEDHAMMARFDVL